MTTSHEPVDDAFTNDLLSIYLQDLQAGRQRTVAEYQELFPGRATDVARELAQLEDDNPTATYQSAPPELPDLPDIEIERVLGRGGQGTVYLGRQSYLERDVAVKILTDNIADTTFRERFRREAKVLASMRHANIVTCHSAGTTATGQHYMVMEFVDGPNLREWLEQQGPMSAHEALRLALDLCAALEHALAAGIIHRDVKPENVLLETHRSKDPAAALTPGYEVKLADLGLARTMTTAGPKSMDVTSDGVVIGSPLTMAPEQFDDPDGVDHRADIFALGCVLYHALAGVPAFQATSITDAIRKKSSGSPPNIAAVREDLPPAVATLVSAMLSFDPADRPQSYGEVRDHCQRILRGPKRSPLWIIVVMLILSGVAAFAVVQPAPPTISTTSPAEVQPGASVTLTALSRSENPKFTWKQVLGPNVALTLASGPSVQFDAPCGYDDIVLGFTVQVTTDSGTAQESVQVTVRGDSDCEPLASGASRSLFADDPAEPLRGWQIPDDRAQWGGDDAVPGAATGLSPTQMSSCRTSLRRGSWTLTGAMEPRILRMKARRDGPLLKKPTKAMGLRITTSSQHTVSLVLDGDRAAHVASSTPSSAAPERLGETALAKVHSEAPLRFEIAWDGSQLVIAFGTNTTREGWQTVKIAADGWHPPSGIELFVDRGLGSFHPMTQTGR